MSHISLIRSSASNSVIGCSPLRQHCHVTVPIYLCIVAGREGDTCCLTGEALDHPQLCITGAELNISEVLTFAFAGAQAKVTVWIRKLDIGNVQLGHLEISLTSWVSRCLMIKASFSSLTTTQYRTFNPCLRIIAHCALVGNAFFCAIDRHLPS